MIVTVPIGARRRRQLDEFYARNIERLGAAIGASGCPFGVHGIGRGPTAYEGDFRTAVKLRTTRPQAGRRRGRIPVSSLARQQWRALVELPLMRRRGQL